MTARGDVHQWVESPRRPASISMRPGPVSRRTRAARSIRTAGRAATRSDPANLAALRVTPPSLPSRQSRYGLSSRGTVLLGFAARTSPVMVSSFLRVDAARRASRRPSPRRSADTAAAAPPAEPPSLGDDCLAFAETGQSACGPFQAYWRQRGGLTLFGLPISDLRYEPNPDDGQTYVVQYFERARFEYHPGLAPDECCSACSAAGRRGAARASRPSSPRPTPATALVPRDRPHAPRRLPRLLDGQRRPGRLRLPDLGAVPGAQRRRRPGLYGPVLRAQPLRVPPGTRRHAVRDPLGQLGRQALGRP